MPKMDCPQPAVEAPAVDDLCVMQPMQWYHGEFVQAKNYSSFVGRARFSFSLCPGSRVTVHVSAHDQARSIATQLYAFATRTYPVELTFPNTNSTARLIYENPGAHPLWIMVVVTTAGDDIPSDASVDVKVQIHGDMDCAPVNFATTTMPDIPDSSTSTTLVC